MPPQDPPSRRPPDASARREREISYHARKCSICRHPRRGEIEEAFLAWDCVSTITAEFQLSGRAALYRHARAVGLLAGRNRGLRGALARIIEKAEMVVPDAMTIVRAVEVFARINDRGEWIASRRPRAADSSPVDAAGGAQARPSRASKNFQIRSIHFRVEHDATR
jgi:hypothetical protein